MGGKGETVSSLKRQRLRCPELRNEVPVACGLDRRSHRGTSGSSCCGCHAEKGARTNAAPRCDLSTVIGRPFKMAAVVKPQAERNVGAPPTHRLHLPRFPAPAAMLPVGAGQPCRAPSWACPSNSPSSNQHTLISVVGCQALLWAQRDKAVLYFTVTHRCLGTFRVVSGAGKGHAGAR